MVTEALLPHTCSPEKAGLSFGSLIPGISAYRAIMLAHPEPAVTSKSLLLSPSSEGSPALADGALLHLPPPPAPHPVIQQQRPRAAKGPVSKGSPLRSEVLLREPLR